MLGGYQDDKEAKSVFLKYAIRYWPYHVALAQNTFNAKVEHKKFFRVKSDKRENWLAVYKQQVRYSDISKGFSIFHVAAKWGIPRLVQFALTNREDISAKEKEVKFNDAEFETDDGVTPLEEAAIAGQAKVMATFLDKGVSNMIIRGSVSLAAAKNKKKGKEIMTLLLDRCGNQIYITKDLVKAAVRYGSRDMLTLLLDRWGDQIPITEDIVEAAAENKEHGMGIMELLLDRLGDQTPITENMVAAAAMNQNSGKDVLELLFKRRRDQALATKLIV